METPSRAPPATDFLASVEILSPLGRDALEQLADAVQVRHYAFGETICKAGDPAEGL
jgi:ATP-binding cassette subfamily B protein